MSGFCVVGEELGGRGGGVVGLWVMGLTVWGAFRMKGSSLVRGLGRWRLGWGWGLMFIGNCELV